MDGQVVENKRSSRRRATGRRSGGGRGKDGSGRGRGRGRSMDAQIWKGFFQDGSVGYHLFPIIRSFLEVEDLVALAKTGYAMNQMARTYTVQELLEESGHGGLEEDTRIQIATHVKTTVTKDDEFKRPRRVALRRKNGYYWANLYHPNELEQIYSLIGSMGYDIRPSQQQPSFPCKRSDRRCRAFFFNSKSGLDASVLKCIRKYLTASDVYALTNANVAHDTDIFHLITLDDVLEQKCIRKYLTASNNNVSARTNANVSLFTGPIDWGVFTNPNVWHDTDSFDLLTLDDVLVQRDVLGDANEDQNENENGTLRKIDRIALGVEVRRAVVSYRGKSRPYRTIDGFADRYRTQYLFHPEEYNQLVSVVETCLRYRYVNRTMDPREGRVLIGAKFGGADVTYRVASLVRQSNGYLDLRPPMRLHGTTQSSTTFRYWYIRLFGDPVPCKTKTLFLTTADPSNPSNITTWVFSENEETLIKLAV